MPAGPTGQGEGPASCGPSSLRRRSTTDEPALPRTASKPRHAAAGKGSKADGVWVSRPRRDSTCKGVSMHLTTGEAQHMAWDSHWDGGTRIMAIAGHHGDGRPFFGTRCHMPLVCRMHGQTHGDGLPFYAWKFTHGKLHHPSPFTLRTALHTPCFFV